MTIKRKMVLPLALAVGALGLMAVSQVASGSHVRPKGASPLRTSLVPSYKACTTANRTHGAPLAFPSCNPPVQSSNFLTLGTPDANGAGANSVGAILLRLKSTSPEDVLINSTISDVRCRPATAASVCGTANGTDGPDYSGQLQGNATIRISDHYNGPGLNEAATVIDIPFPVTGTCASTVSTTVGGTCTTATTANAVVAGSVKDTQRGGVAIGPLPISDAGARGAPSAAGATLLVCHGNFLSVRLSAP